MTTDIHKYEYTPAEIREVFPSVADQEVIATAAFRRLNSIKFLGAIDYILPPGSKRPKKRHSRYQHSLAVAALAKRYSETKNFSVADSRYCIVSALLHDIGHAPLSHSLESVFRSQFELDHHVSGERIIKGEVPIGVGLAATLADNGINNFRVLSIIAGHDAAIFNEVFSHSINIDTIEAILRSLTYVYKVDSQLTASRVLDALIARDDEAHNVLDAFWEAKDVVYTKLIQGRMGLMADYICKRYMELNAEGFRASYYYGTETELRRDHRRLFDVLEEFGRSQHIPNDIVAPNQELRCVLRRFKVDTTVRLSDIGSIDRRYVQQKQPITFNVKKAIFDESEFRNKHLSGGDLF